MTRMATCHPEKPYQAKGLCTNCYARTRYRPKTRPSIKRQTMNYSPMTAGIIALLTIVGRSSNRSPEPFGCWWEDGQWWVGVELDSRRATVDIYEHADTLPEALKKTHRKLMEALS